jgi:hypothetical protein
MKIRLITPIIATAALDVAFLAEAHDPKECVQDAENPNCIRDTEYFKLKIRQSSLPDKDSMLHIAT